MCPSLRQLDERSAEPVPLEWILSLSLLSLGLQKPQPLPVRVKVSLLTIRMSATVGELGVKLNYDPSSAETCWAQQSEGRLWDAQTSANWYGAVLMDRRLSGCRISLTPWDWHVPILAPLTRDCFLCCVRAELCEASVDYIPPLQLLGCKCLVWILLPAQHTAVVFLIFDSTCVERAKLPFAEEKHEVVQS